MLLIPGFIKFNRPSSNVFIVSLFILSLIINFSITQQLLANEQSNTISGTRLKNNYTVNYPKIKLYDIEITDSNNNKVNLKTELNNSPILINFIFTSCNAICPILSSTFSQIQKRFNEINVNNLKLISFSIDPEQDSPARLKDYAKKFNAGKHWKFFTGTKADMLKIENSFGNFRGNKMNHLPYTFIRINKNSKWIRLTGFVKTSDIINELNNANRHK